MWTKNKSDIALSMGMCLDPEIKDRFDVAKKAVDLILEQISESLVAGKHVEIRDFGAFKVKTYGSKLAYFRNPETGVVTYKPRNTKAVFKAGKELKNRVDYERGRI